MTTYEEATEAATLAVFTGTSATAALDVSGATAILIAHGGTGTVSVTECATSNGSFTTVDAADLVTGDGTIGYIGNKRYIKVVGSTATISGAVVKLGCRYCPTA
ncbi:MAG: hypothetical protein WCR83_05590 [Candidatus Methanomethylophilaceae archaeon]